MESIVAHRREADETAGHRVGPAPPRQVWEHRANNLGVGTRREAETRSSLGLLKALMSKAEMTDKR